MGSTDIRPRLPWVRSPRYTTSTSHLSSSICKGNVRRLPQSLNPWTRTRAHPVHTGRHLLRPHRLSATATTPRDRSMPPALTRSSGAPAASLAAVALSRLRPQSRQPLSTAPPTRTPVSSRDNSPGAPGADPHQAPSRPPPCGTGWPSCLGTQSRRTPPAGAPSAAPRAGTRRLARRPPWPRSAAVTVPLPSRPPEWRPAGVLPFQPGGFSLQTSVLRLQVHQTYLALDALSLHGLASVPARPERHTSLAAAWTSRKYLLLRLLRQKVMCRSARCSLSGNQSTWAVTRWEPKTWHCL